MTVQTFLILFRLFYFCPIFFIEAQTIWFTHGNYSTVTLLARFLGWSTLLPRITAMW